MSELGDAGDLGDRVVAAGNQCREEVALRDSLAHAQWIRPRLSWSGLSVRWTSARSDATTTRPCSEAMAARTLSRSVDSSCSANARSSGRAARPEDAQVTATKPGGEVVGDAVSLLVGACDDDERYRSRQGCAPRGEVGRPRRSGHAKNARLRQMGPKGVDERSDAAITAA